jgi:muramidase (phage lysozyme)
MLAFLYSSPPQERNWIRDSMTWQDSTPTVTPLPLTMRGGDPYIRALMRTISASESNTSTPYAVLYGGQHIKDLSRHPDRCITIRVGPNRGNCTTAAGRYQFLTTTWQEKARLYHPEPPAWYTPWSTYSFEPQYQDQVVHAWLSDPAAWGYDLSALLQQGQVDQVLELLSGTWTSLGYGIESNSMTSRLPEIYSQVLQEELEAINFGHLNSSDYHLDNPDPDDPVDPEPQPSVPHPN